MASCALSNAASLLQNSVNCTSKLGVIASVTFPNHRDLPTQSCERRTVPTVTSDISGQFWLPVFSVGLRFGGERASAVLVPKAAVNEDDKTEL